jgi:hypothetical protein
MELLDEYPVPPQEELSAAWAEYVGEGQIVMDAPDVYGVLTRPSETPKAYASVDLC